VALNGQCGSLAKSADFRKNLQEHAGTGAIRQEKAPTENGWGFVIGGAGGNIFDVSCCRWPSPDVK
jgi:hypothetical protein